MDIGTRNPFCSICLPHFNSLFRRSNQFSLIYGMEVVSPIEIEIPSLQSLMETELVEAGWIQPDLISYNFIKENRTTILRHGWCYQRRISRTYDEKVKPIIFLMILFSRQMIVLHPMILLSRQIIRLIKVLLLGILDKEYCFAIVLKQIRWKLKSSIWKLPNK